MFKVILRKIRTGLNIYILSPVITMVKLPIFIKKEVIDNFILTKEDPNDEFIAFGEGRALSGLTYWLARSRRIKKCGVFGIALEDYMGIPLALHQQPLALFLLAKLGYRKYVGVSILLFIISSFALAWATSNYYLLLLTPLVICSSYFMEHLYLGNWEILAWPFFILTFSFFLKGLPLLASIFLALAIFSHPGIGLLTTVFTSLYAVLSSQIYPNLFILAFFSFIFAAPFVVPFIRTREKVGRDKIINDVWGYSYKWCFSSLYQFIVYLIFGVSALFFSERFLTGLIILLPLLVLFINVKVRWFFSAYTVRTLMLACGFIYIFINPNIFVISIYLFLIFGDPHVFISFLPSQEYFSLKPVSLSKNREKILSLFKRVPRGSRIAFEMRKRDITWYWNALLGYLIVDEDFEALNTGLVELGDYSIFSKYAKWFNVETSKDKLEFICQQAGISYMVVYSEEFVKRLEAFGYRKLGYVACNNLGLTPGVVAIISLFEFPRRAALIEPETELIRQANKMKFEAKQGQSYLLKYSYFPGWKAFQNGKELKIEDLAPGMRVTAAEDGVVELKYNYLNYWK